MTRRRLDNLRAIVTGASSGIGWELTLQLAGQNVVTAMEVGDSVPMLFVQRLETHVAGPLEFDTYQPNSDLMRADLVVGANGSIQSVGAATSLLGACPGTAAARDVSSPSVNIDGQTVAFSMRLAGGEPRRIYTVNIDGSGCQLVSLGKIKERRSALFQPVTPAPKNRPIITFAWRS